MASTRLTRENPSVQYVQAACVPSEELCNASGIAREALIAIKDANCLPRPTYRVYANGAVESAILVHGRPSGAARNYYSPPVIWWMKRASEQCWVFGKEQLATALKNWLRVDLRRALLASGEDILELGWGHICNDDGSLSEERLVAEIEEIWTDWMEGAYAVCLRRFDGYHLATKEIERARIALITSNGERLLLERDDRVALLDAIERLDAVILPFAPHERPHGTPGLFIDANLTRYKLPGASAVHPTVWHEPC